MTNRRGVLVIGIVVAVVVFSLLTGATALLGGGGPGSPPAVGEDGDVVATHTSLHLDRTGRPTVVGEVVNRAGGPITDVEVTVTFFRDGDPIGQASGTVIRSPVPDQLRSPFDLRLTDPVDEVPDEYSVAVDYAPFEGTVYGQLSTTDVRVTRESQDSIELVGEVRNEGDRTVEKPRVVAIFYSENGSVVGVRSTRPSPAELRPEETGVFRVTFNTLGDVPSLAREYDSHRIVVFTDDQDRTGSRAALQAPLVLTASER